MNRFYPGLICLALTACDSGIRGNYSDGGAASYDFKPKGIVVVTLLGRTSELTYDQTDADHIRVNGPKGSLSFTRQQDGAWLGPMEVKLTKIGRQ